MTDLEYLEQTLQLAAQGASLVSPNPLVGSVVVNHGQIVGRGYHRFDDLKHAEVWALEEAGPRARGSTVYVNLEPCCHRGPEKRTPPCVDSLIAAGVSRVVASMLDPNPAVNGSGFARLANAGIDVTVGGLERQARRLNEKYVCFVTTGKPFVHLKLGCSIDGKIATRTGASKWITGEESRAAAQTLRHEYDAILVGINTVIADDPLLSDRTGSPRHRPLVRVVLDGELRLPLGSQLLRTARELPLLVFAVEDKLSSSDVSAKRSAIEALGAEVIPVECEDGRLDLYAVLAELGRRRIVSLIVEGGSEIAGSFISRNLVNKATFFYAPKIVGGRDAVSAIGGEGIALLDDAPELREVQLVRRGDDWEVTGYLSQLF
jgi:diaminohydroxyphosphoribosylaminopyrimidine deaminase/5-amino-6-(5-phosphoribosylamino)uracil reductase